MIQSAMMFALGALVSGLLALAFCVALVRRTRRITEKRLLAAIATRRAEFEAEREELRARHAVELFRLEKEVGRILDMATAHRLESDVKDRDLNALHAELAGRDDELADLKERLAEARDDQQELERRAAEAGAQLRATRHSLKLEVKRRVDLDEQLDKALSDETQRQGEVASLRAENETLRTMLVEYQRAGYTKSIVSRPAAIADEASMPALDGATAASGGASIVSLPMRGRPQLPAVDADFADGEAEVLTIERAADELSRLSGAAQAELDPPWYVDAHLSDTDSDLSGEDIESDLEIPARRAAAADKTPADGSDELSPEERVFDAIAEIRALKRTAGQAGE